MRNSPYRISSDEIQRRRQARAADIGDGEDKSISSEQKSDGTMCQWKTWFLAFALILGSSGSTKAQTLFQMDFFADDFLAFLSRAELPGFDGSMSVGALNTKAQQLAHDPTMGTLLAYDADTGLLRVNSENGLATVIGPLGLDVDVLGLTVDTEGTPWVLAEATVSGSNRYQLVRLDPATGAAVANLVLDDHHYFDLAAVGTRLVSVINDAQGAHLVDIDPVTGRISVGASTFSFRLHSITSNADHDALVMALVDGPYSFEIYEVEPDNGAAVLLGEIGVGGGIHGSHLADLAIAPARGITDVPTLGGIGIAALATLLALAGLLVQRRG